MEKKSSHLDSRNKAKRLLEIALSKQAYDPLPLNLTESGLIWDYFVIVSSNSERHATAIVDEMLKVSKAEGLVIHHIEKDDDKSWFLLDYFDVLVHVFSEEKRNFYRLERLFKKAKRARFRLK